MTNQAAEREPHRSSFAGNFVAALVAGCLVMLSILVGQGATPPAVPPSPSASESTDAYPAQLVTQPLDTAYVRRYSIVPDASGTIAYVEMVIVTPEGETWECRVHGLGEIELDILPAGCWLRHYE